MNHINQINFNNVELNSDIDLNINVNISAIKLNDIGKSDEWMNVQHINNAYQLSEIYKNIFHQHKDQNKWILMINPEDEQLDLLVNQQGIDVSRILRVDTKNAEINLKNVEKALVKGNCSAIILSNTQLKQSELFQLSNSAQRGKTQCIVLENTLTFH